MKAALIVGGASGVGLAIAQQMLKKGLQKLYLVDKEAPRMEEVDETVREAFLNKTHYIYVNLADENYSFLEQCAQIDTLVITAGFGRVAPFESLTGVEIKNLTKVNQLAVFQIIKHYYDKIKSQDDFFCAVMGSIAGHVVSPLFSVYGATKAGVCSFIENVNTELEACGCKNRILDVSPGSIQGTRFHSDRNNLEAVMPLAKEIIDRMQKRERLYIPAYDTVYQGVIERYRDNPMQYGLESYTYKQEKGTINLKPQVVVGYLSGTFDLFHIGHLNLLRRAKEKCDYLIVGVHKSGAWKKKATYIPFEERVAILESIKYVDKVVESCQEDSDAWALYHYDKLFVGSDYKGSERFARYEAVLADKGVEIVYFPYTQGTSSTQLRSAIEKTIGE